MRQIWNDSVLESTYKYIRDDAILYGGFEIGTLFPEDLNNEYLKTKSKRIRRMLNLAYYLGMLRGIRLGDEAKDPISRQ